MKQNRTMCRYASLNSKLTKQNNLSEESQSNIRPRNGTSNIPTNICNIQSFSRKNSIDNHKLIFDNQRIENHRFHTDTNKRKEDQAQRKEKLKQNRLYTTLYNLKHVHLKTEPTTRQKDRFMRKLGQTVNEDIFKAVGYDFDPKCCQLVFDYITTNMSITKIILDNNPLGDQGILKLSQLVHQIDLEELSLVSVGMGNKGAVALFTGLWIKNTIKKLNISSVDCSFKNKISAQGVFNLKQLLNSKSCVLTHLHMDYISLGNQGLKSAFQGVQSSPLQELTLSRNELTSKRMQIFAYGIANTCLSKLDISCNNIGNEGCKYLSEILGSSYGKNRISINLTYLNLASNNINSLGLEGFCRNMCVNQILQTLILDNNLLSQGNRFFHIKYYLTKNWSLKKLSLVNISCNQKDIRFLSQGIQASRSLQQLNLSKNEIDGQSLSNLFMMISRNKSLKRLKLNTCKISDASLLKNQLQITGATYQRIQQIEMQNNYIGNKGGQILKKMANNNVTILRLSLAKNCIGQKILISINQTLKENQRKRPFDTEFKHLQSMANIYEQKKAGLKSEIQRSRDRELFLTKLMILGDIRNKQIVQQNLNALIKNEKRSIRRIRRKRRGSKFVNNKKTEQNDENSQFLTLISNRSEQMSKVIRRLSPQISIKF